MERSPNSYRFGSAGANRQNLGSLILLLLYLLADVLLISFAGSKIGDWLAGWQDIPPTVLIVIGCGIILAMFIGTMNERLGQVLLFTAISAPIMYAIACFTSELLGLHWRDTPFWVRAGLPLIIPVLLSAR